MIFQRYRAQAITLKALRDKLTEAIELLGENAIWAGHDNQNLYVWDYDGEVTDIIEISILGGTLDDNAKTGHETTEDNSILPSPHLRKGHPAANSGCYAVYARKNSDKKVLVERAARAYINTHS